MPQIKIKDCDTGASQQQIEALARCLLPEILKFFDSEESQREFEEWKKQQLTGCKAIE